MKTLTIATNTARETLRQPLFLILAFLGSVLIMLFIIIPYYTFGEDIKMLKDTGLALILILSLFLSLWTSSVTIAEDIEHRTAVTLLSKPINRRQFIIGKFLGILLGVGLLFLILSVVFELAIFVKLPYDAKESASVNAPALQEQLDEMIQVLPGLVLTFFQIVVLSALSVAISTRLPMIMNLVICLTVYFLGHLAEVLVQESQGPNSYEIVTFTAKMLDLILPALPYFNVTAAVATGATVPISYLLANLGYCIVYSTICILFAFILFEDRDLA